MKKIAGIRKTGKYSLTFITSGYSDDTIKSLHIPICPLHYYGNEQRYNYKKGNFGFKKEIYRQFVPTKNLLWVQDHTDM